MGSETRILIFSGQVQGVGFRMTAVRMAHDLPLAGTVRNLPTGDVELVLHGNSADINALVRRLAEHFDASVRTLDKSPIPEPPPSAGVRIVH